ncbi:MAG: flagellar biosynthetic protein FliO [Leptospirales bacterium]|nr:flagellar biosynthetic protein FliO [Leptospirales bacterium]
MLVFCAVQPLFAAPKEARKTSPSAEKKINAKTADTAGEGFLIAAAAENKENKENQNQEKPETEADVLPAANYLEDDFMPQTSESSYAWDIFKLLLVLGLMVGSFYFFFRYISKKTGINARGGDIMRTIAIVPVGQNKYIQVIDLAGKLLVIGVADNGINLITEITNKDDIDRIRLMGSFDDKTAGAAPATFQDFLKERIGRGIGKVTEKIHERRSPGVRTYEYTDDSVDFEYIKNQNGRLKKL